MPPMDELLHVGPGAEPHVIVLDGELDMSTTDQLDAAVAERHAAGITDITLDVAALAFIDSRGLRSLLIAARSGIVSLRRPSPALLRLLQVSGLDGHFPVID